MVKIKKLVESLAEISSNLREYGFFGTPIIQDNQNKFNTGKQITLVDKNYSSNKLKKTDTLEFFNGNITIQEMPNLLELIQNYTINNKEELYLVENKNPNYDIYNLYETTNSKIKYSNATAATSA